MVRRPALAVGIFSVWTFVVWVGRIRNVLEDDELSGGGRAIRLGLAVVFVVGAVVIGGLLPGGLRRAGTGVERLRTAVDVVGAVTIAVWAVRGVGILLDEGHTAGFKIVHTALALMSIGLTLLAWRATQLMEGIEHERVIPE